MRLSLALLVLLACPTLCSAQSEKYDLRTLLHDSAYIFNRFEEATAGLHTEIDDWDVPVSLRKGFKEELSAISRNVEAEKPTLNRLLLKSRVSTVELFDVYSEVSEVASELQGQASNAANWGNSAKAIELADLGAKAGVLAGKLGVNLREKIEAQESQMEACTSRSLPATNHK